MAGLVGATDQGLGFRIPGEPFGLGVKFEGSVQPDGNIPKMGQRGGKMPRFGGSIWFGFAADGIEEVVVMGFQIRLSGSFFNLFVSFAKQGPTGTLAQDDFASWAMG